MSKFYLLSPLVLQTLLWPFTKIFFGFFGHFKIKGLENLKNLRKDRGVVFAVNHTSELDPIIVPASLPFLSPLMPMFYTSREKSFYNNSGWRQIFYGGFFFKIWGAHPLNSGKKNYGISLKNHIKILKAGQSLCIFPEGRTTRDGELQEGRGGVAYLSDMLHCPIVPVYIGGVYRLSLKEILFRKRTFTVSFGKPVYREEILQDKQFRSVADYKAGAQIIMRKIAELKNEKNISLWPGPRTSVPGSASPVGNVVRKS